MRYLYSVFFFIIISTNVLSAESIASLNPVNKNNSYYEWKFSLTINGKYRTMRILTVGEENETTKRVVYIFHGYKPEGDPYNQEPSQFAIRWNLAVLAKNESILFVLPDCGASMYPLPKSDDPNNDLFMLESLNRYVTEKWKPSSASLVVGFSAGVEGAIKFAKIIQCKEIVAISGNYDLTRIPPGEKKFHERIFGNDQTVMRKESPLSILSEIKNTTVHLFCEENNKVNRFQAQILVDAHIPGISIVDWRSLGKGHYHNWVFLQDPKITETLTKIIKGNFNKEINP